MYGFTLLCYGVILTILSFIVPRAKFIYQMALFLCMQCRQAGKYLLDYYSILMIDKIKNNSFTFQMNVKIASIYLLVISKLQNKH